MFGRHRGAAAISCAAAAVQGIDGSVIEGFGCFATAGFVGSVIEGFVEASPEGERAVARCA
eukprot:9189336-Pyramimonas_sp.AAC.1